MFFCPPCYPQVVQLVVQERTLIHPPLLANMPRAQIKTPKKKSRARDANHWTTQAQYDHLSMSLAKYRTDVRGLSAEEQEPFWIQTTNNFFEIFPVNTLSNYDVTKSDEDNNVLAVAVILFCLETEASN